MKTKLFPILALAILSQVANAQITVIDPAAIVKLADQINQMKQQYNIMQNQLKAVTGTRGMENIANDPKRTNYLPQNYQSVLNGGAGNANAVRDAYKKFGIEDSKVPVPKEYRDHFNAGAKSKAANYAAMDAAYSAVSQRFNDMDKLLNKLKTTNDPKDVADLQARIAAEQTILTNEGNRIQLLNNLAQAEERLREQQGNEMVIKSAGQPVPRY